MDTSKCWKEGRRGEGRKAKDAGRMAGVCSAIRPSSRATSLDWKSLPANAMILPPVPSPWSYHRFKSVFTLNEAFCSCRNGDLYQRFPPCLETGRKPRLCSYSSSLISFASFIVIVFFLLHDGNLDGQERFGLLLICTPRTILNLSVFCRLPVPSVLYIYAPIPY